MAIRTFDEFCEVTANANGRRSLDQLEELDFSDPSAVAELDPTYWDDTDDDLIQKIDELLDRSSDLDAFLGLT